MLTVPAMASRRHTAKMDTLASQTDVLNATRPSQFNKEEFSSPKKQPASQVCAGSKKAHTETDKVPENQNEPDKRKFLSSEKGQASAVDKDDKLFLGQTVAIEDCEDKSSVVTQSSKADLTEPTKQNDIGKQESPTAIIGKVYFECSCGRKFDTQRGLSLHHSHFPEHRPNHKQVPNDTKSPPMSLPLPNTEYHTPSHDEPTSPRIKSASPLHSPTSSPSSPTSFNLSAFKTSARNPQYYSIIRTRSSSGSVVETEVGIKRARGTPSSTPGAPPSKTLQLNSGEKVPTGELSEESDKEKESPLNKKKSTKELEASKMVASSHRPRTRSFSNSDPVSPTLKTSPDGAAFEGSATKNSPITRSNSATMKAPEFISLPTRRRRGGKRGGRGRGGSFTGRFSEEVEGDDDAIGEDFLVSPQAKDDVDEKNIAPEPPQKRKRGRPPKNRKDVPETTPPVPKPKKTTGDSSKSGGNSASSSKNTKPTKPSDKETEKAAQGKNPDENNSTKGESGDVDNSDLPLWESFGSEAENETKKASKTSSSQPPPTSSQATPTFTSSKQCSYVVTSQKDASGGFKAVTVTTLSKKSSQKEIVREEGTKTKRRSTRKESLDNDNNEETPSSSKANDSVADAEVGVVTDDSTHKQKTAGDTGSSTSTKTRTRSKTAKSKVDKEVTKNGKESTSKTELSAKKDKNSSSAESEESSKNGGSDSQQHRQSSVIVSVLSREGQPSEEDNSKQAPETKPPGGQPPEPEPQNNNIRRVSSQDQPFPPTSSPTQSYVPPFHYPGPYPHPTPIMYPPGPPSSMYHHPYYGFPGGPSSGGHPHQVPPYGHHVPPGMVVPPGHAHPGSPMGPSDPHMSPPQHGGLPPFPNSGSQVMTTVSGVQVSVLDKPPTQLPTVTVPLQMSSGNMAAGGRPRPMYAMEGGSPGSPMGSQPMLRPYMHGAGMSSPEDVPHQHPHSHPLTHAYRPGMIPPPHHGIPGYPPMPHPQPPYHPHPHLAVRLDHSGMPYMEWAPEHKPPPPEEPPARPVECPECGRMFKNNKALNGHMRLHGGFDWTKKPFTALDQSKQSNSATASNTKTTNKASEEGKQNSKKPKSSGSRKRSRSGSRSRSRSKSPSLASGKASSKRRRSSEDTKAKSGKGGKESLTPLPVPRAPSVFTFEKVDGSHAHTPSNKKADHHPQGHNATLDDLCRAAELLGSIDNRGEDVKGGKNPHRAEDPDSEFDENGRKRPKNITIPQSQSTPVIERERLRLGATPPYTPPPILSPSRSLTMLAPGIPTQPGTPCRILHHWSSRRSSDGHPFSESDESYNEPRINVGKEFQADLPDYSESHSAALQSDSKSVKVWQVLDDLTQEDEATIDGYLEIACSPAVLHAGRNKEMALHYLYQLGGSVKEAVRCMLAGKSVFTSSHPMTKYNYSGSERWSGRERQQFRRAWRVHRKQFHLLRSAVESKTMSEVIEYYYSWKKYCSDEYRGRNRHFSEEILSDEDIGDIRSSSSETSGENDTPPFTSSTAHTVGKKHPEIKREKISPPLSDPKFVPHQKNLTHARSLASQSFHNSIDGEYDHLPIVYAPHTSQPASQSIHQYKCKYPGCNQVFTSIFALNGHIRVHGGSFYPKPHGGSSSSQHQKATPSTHLQMSSQAIIHPTTQGKVPLNKLVESRSQQQLELAKALLELPQPRSPAKHVVSYNTPSPKPSPKSRSPAGVKKKLSSSSPGEREGYYPCNRCGRVFTKVKSRSAHMKSHIVKQN